MSPRFKLPWHCCCIIMDKPIRPPNFSWVEEGKIAAMAYPSQPGNFKYLQNEGVAYLVALTSSKPNIPEECNIRLFHIPINDFTPPTIRQIEEFLSLVDMAYGEKKLNEKYKKGEIFKQRWADDLEIIGETFALAVHCQTGRGRCGTMLACYLVRKLHLSGRKAIEEIRTLRPGSIETREQEDMVETFHLHLKQIGKL